MKKSRTIQEKLIDLRNEHRDLDVVIDQLTVDGSYNQVQVQRL